MWPRRLILMPWFGSKCFRVFSNYDALSRCSICFSFAPLDHGRKNKNNTFLNMACHHSCLKNLSISPLPELHLTSLPPFFSNFNPSTARMAHAHESLESLPPARRTAAVLALPGNTSCFACDMTPVMDHTGVGRCEVWGGGVVSVF